MPLHPVFSKGVSHARVPSMWPAGSSPGIDAICGLILLLVFSPAPRRFSQGTSIRFPSPQKPTLSIPIRSGTHGHVSTSCYKKDQSNCFIHWKEIYSVDSAIHRLSNCCLVFKCITFFFEETTRCRFTMHFFSVCVKGHKFLFLDTPCLAIKNTTERVSFGHFSGEFFQDVYIII